jgi:hypothetical protein
MNAPLFRDLSISDFTEMAGAGQERIFLHNQILFGEGDPLRWVSIITSGHAKTIRNGAAGKLMILHISGPGDVLDGLGTVESSVGMWGGSNRSAAASRHLDAIRFGSFSGVCESWRAEFMNLPPTVFPNGSQKFCYVSSCNGKVLPEARWYI